MSETLLNPGRSLDDVLTAIRAGDEDAVRMLIDYYEPGLRRILRVTRVIRLLQSQIDSEDVVQSVFARVIGDIRANRVEFAEWEGVEAYLNKVGRNRLRDAIRRGRRRRSGMRGGRRRTGLRCSRALLRRVRVRVRLRRFAKRLRGSKRVRRHRSWRLSRSGRTA